MQSERKSNSGIEWSGMTQEKSTGGKFLNSEEKCIFPLKDNFCKVKILQ